MDGAGEGDDRIVSPTPAQEKEAWLRGILVGMDQKDIFSASQFPLPLLALYALGNLDFLRATGIWHPVRCLSRRTGKFWSLGVHYAELFLRPLVSGSHFYGVFYDPTASCSEFALGVQEYGYFWKTTSGMVSVFSTPWFDSGCMLDVSLRGLLASTLQKTADSPQLQFIQGRRHPCLYADAVLYGSDCSENHRDSPVARRHDGRCPFRAGCTGSHVQVVGGTVVLPKFLLVAKIVVSYEDADIPIVMQRPILMVQRWTIQISQLLFVLGGRCPFLQSCRFQFCSCSSPWSSSPKSWRRFYPTVQTVRQTIVIPQLLTRWSTSLFPGRAGSLLRRGAEASPCSKLFV